MSRTMLSFLMRPTLGALAVLVLTSTNAQLTVTTQTDLQQLAASITGPGVQITNPVITCHANGYGEFTYSGNDMDVDQGVILTTGRRTDAPGPNNNGGSNWFAQNTAGDPLLNTVTGRTTMDACKFEFDIIPAGDSLSFDFVFASEEYNEWVGSQYNDVFGFFISGPGIVGDPGAGGAKNIALIPNTATAVTINNVNNGSNSAYYHDNTGGADLQYDGFTVGLKAASVVTACQTYHLKLVVADASDRKFDSGVFIDRVESPTITMSSYTANGGPDMIEGCNPGWVRFDRGAPRPTPLTLQYFIQGTATNGTDYATIAPINPNSAKFITIPANQTYVDRPVDPLSDIVNENTEDLLFILGNPNCPAQNLDSLVFNILDTLIATISPGGTICVGGSWPLTVTGGASYAWSPAVGLSCTTCPNPIATPAVTTTYTVVITDGSCTRTANRTVRVSDLTLSAVEIDPLCNGDTNGAINLSHAGGYPPYAYTWTGPNGFTANSQDISGLATGTYTVTVTDAGCTRSQSFTLTAPGVLGVSLSPTILAFGQNLSCFGGSDGAIDATVSGGTGPYATTWTGPNGYSNTVPDILGLTAGSYTLNVTDANGCTASANSTLIEATQVIAAINTSAPVVCSGDGQGSATVTPSGGVPPYAFSWNTSPMQNAATAIALLPGTWTVTVTDGYNCPATANVTIGGPTTALSTSLTAQTNVLCFGNTTGSAGISISGGTAPYTTSWNTTPVQNGTIASDLPAGTWTATVIDANGCTTTRNVTITQPASGLSASLFAQTNVGCFGQNTGSATVTATGGTGPYTYQWNTTPVQNTATASNLPAGNYTCTVSDVNLCSTTVNVVITEPASAMSANISASTNVLCYGASTGSATVSASGGTAPLSYNWNTSPVQSTATATNLPAGNYTVTITDANACSLTRNVTIAQPAAALQANLLSTTNETCFGSLAGSATLSVTGGSGSYSISWNSVPVQTGLLATGLATGGYIATVTDNNGCANIATVNVTISGPTAAMAMTSTSGNPLCAGDNTGSIDINVTGGVGGYGYAWTGPNGFNSTNQDFPSGGLIAGTYQATVTDANNCTLVQSFTLSDPSALAMIGSVTNVNCFGEANGAIAITASGATPPYVHSWTGPGAFTSSNEDLSGLMAGTYTMWLRDANDCDLIQNWTVTQPTLLSASIASQTNISCNGGTGSATVTVTGGTTAYSFSWNTSPVQTSSTATNLPAGTWTCTVTDAHGCTTSASVTITQPGAPLSANIASSTNVLCFGNTTGAATVNVSGGTGPYSYSWNTSPLQNAATVINLPAGNYTCTVTDNNGCVTTANVTIAQPAAALSTSLGSSTNVLCFGNSTGSASVNASGGTAPYGFSWNTSPAQSSATAINLPAGNYTCTITDANGCTTTRNVTIAQPAAGLSANISGSTNVLCHANSTGGATVNVSGGTPSYSYSWNSSPVQTTATASNLPAGSYTCTITDANGCTATASVIIAQPAAALSANIGSSTSVLCHGNSTGSATVSVNGGTPSYSYSWNSTPVQTTATASNLPAGSYTCTITDANGCTATSSVTISQPLAALSANISNSANVLCYANSTGNATVNVSGGTAAYSYSWNSSPVQTTAAANNLPAGNYTCTITDANGCAATANVTITQPAAALGVTAVVAPAACQGANDGAVNATVTGGTGTYFYAWTGPNGFTSGAQDVSSLQAGVYQLIVTDANGCTHTSTWNVNQPGLFTVSGITSSYTGGVEVSCAGGTNGSIDMTVNGATPPYTYAWSGPNGYTNSAIDISGLEAGTYTFVVTDANGCATSQVLTLNAPQPFVLGLTSADMGNGFGITCNGGSNGSIDATITGGTAPLSIGWTGPSGFSSNNEDLSALIAGNYDLTVSDANGCGATQSITLTEPSAIAFTASVTTQVLCFSNATGAATSNATGGVAPIGYSWNTFPAQVSPNAAGLTAGTWTATATDANGCTAQQNVAITQPLAALAANVSAQTNVLCHGNSSGSTTANASGGTGPYQYAWNTSPAQNTATAINLVVGNYSCIITDANGCSTSVNTVITEPTASLSASVSGSADVLCFGNSSGSATVDVVGGTAPYLYSWNSSPVQTNATASDLPAGNYTCIITDANGCTTSASVTIAQPAAPLSASIVAQVNVACGGTTGSATAGVLGGTAPYAYSWNTAPIQTNATASNLGAGTYTCTITDASGCTTTTSSTITAPAGSLAASITSTIDVLCFGNSTGSAAVDITGGTIPYGISWNTSPVQSTATATNLPAGVWTCTIVDANGCSAQVTATIAQPSAVLSAAISAHTDVACFGNATGDATVDVTGGTAPYGITWNTAPVQSANAAANLPSGTYTVTITDANGCAANTSLQIAQPVAALNASISAQTNVACGGNTGSATVNVNGGTLPFTYSWNTAPAQTTATATNLGAGTWTCTITDANGCTTAVDATITAPTGSLSASLSASADVDCFGSATGSATVNASLGTAPYSYFWNSSPAQGNATATGLPAGTYLCTITDANGCTALVSATIAQPAQALSAGIATQSGVSCFGAQDGAANAEASGGSAPYDYLWNSSPVQNSAGLSSAGPGTYTVTITDDHGCSASAQAIISSPIGALNVSLLNTTDQSCFGSANGQASVTVTGGTAPFTYTWNTVPPQTSASAVGLSTGTYMVNVVDAYGCNGSLSVAINGPSAPLSVQTISMNDVLCHGASTGSASVSAAGGSAPYTYTWNTNPVVIGADLLNVPAGTYTAQVVDDNGCNTSTNITITQPIAPLHTFVESYANVSCFGGSDGYATVDISGGSGSYTVLWNTVPPQSGTTATGLSAGIWNVSITDNNGCGIPKLLPVTITEPAAALAINSTISTFGAFNVSCQNSEDGWIDVSLSGGTPPYNYAWTDDFGQLTGIEDISDLSAGNYYLTVSDGNGCTVSTTFSLTAPDPLQASGAITTAACQGASDGAVDVTVLGGSAPYTYTWTGPNAYTAVSEDLIGLAAGTYAVLITDANGCTLVRSFDVNQPGLFNITATLSDLNGSGVSCSGSADGSIDVTTTGGTAPYVFNWTGPNGYTAVGEDISALGAGIYNLSITDANGCGSLQTYTLTEPVVLHIITLVDQHGNGQISCAGGNDGGIDATIGGGTPNYTIAWSGPNGFNAASEDLTNLSTGTYTITVTDLNGCQASASVTLNEPPVLTSSITVSQTNSGDAIACNGGSDGSIDLHIQGGNAPYSVLWSGPNGFTSNATDPTGLAAGTYTALITDSNGCTTGSTSTLTEPAPLDLTSTVSSFLGGNAISCNGAEDGSIDLTPTGGAGNLQFQWLGSNAFTSTNEDLSGLAPGPYQVLTIDQNGCSAGAFFVLNEPQPIGSTASITTALCQGTATGAVDMTVTGGTASYNIAWSGPSGFNSAGEDLSGVLAGVYIATITDANGCESLQFHDVDEPGIFLLTELIGVYPGGFNTSCAYADDGGIDLTATGGTPGYTYDWYGPNGYSANAEDISGLVAGQYALILTDANGCSTLAQYTLTSAAPVVVGLVAGTFSGGVNTSCADTPDGSIDATIVGGIPPYGISWSGPNGFAAISEDLTGLEPGTYSVEVSDAVGCKADASITLTAPDPVDAVVITSNYGGNANVSCFGAADGTIDLTINGGSLPYVVLWSGPNGFVSGQEDLSGLSTGVYSFSITDANGCKVLGQVNITTPPPIGLTLHASQFNGGYNVPCADNINGTITTQASGGTGNLSYAWTGPNGFTSNAALLSGLEAGTYMVIVTDDNGCTASTSITLTEPQPLNVADVLSDAGNGYQISCAVNDGSIDLTVSGGTTPIQISWSGPNGFGSQAEDIIGLEAGGYIYSVIDGNGCTDSDTITLAAPTALTGTLAVSGNICDGTDDGAIDLSLVGGIAPYTFFWTGPNGFTSTNEDLTDLSGGNYAVNVSDAGTCTGSWTGTITASAAMDLSAYLSTYGSLNIPCVGDSTGVIEVQVGGGAAPVNVVWTGPNGFSANNITDLSGLVVGDYTVMITDANGCTLDSTFTLIGPTSQIDPSMIASLFASGTNVSCVGASDGSVDLTVIGGTAPYLFDWRGPDSTQFSTEDINGLIAGTYDLVITDSNQCTFPATITLTEPDSALVAQLTLSQYNGGFNTSCDGSTDGTLFVELSGGNGGYLLNWSGPNGFSSAADSLSGLAAGTYTLTATDVNGCALIQDVVVTAPDPIDPLLTPFAFPSGSNTSCAGANDGSIALALTGGVPGYAYVWLGPNGYSSSDSTIVDLAPGTYCLSLSDANGCNTQTCTDVIAAQALDASTSTTSADCGASGGSVDLNVQGGGAPFTFEWDNGAQTEDISGLLPGTYVVMITDVNGCTLPDSASVSGSPALLADASVTNNACNESTIGAIDLSIVSGTAPYLFDWSTGANTEDLSGLASSTYVIAITDAAGCSWTNTYIVGQGSEITADSLVLEYPSGFNLSAYESGDGSITVTPSGGTGPYTYQWSNGSTSAMNNGLDAGTYSVIITDANGCSLMLVFTLDQPMDLVMPTGYTPNNDGSNDQYVVHGLEAFKENHITIFNRWGNVVYDRMNYANDWAGENQEGGMLPNGTYFIVLTLNKGGQTLQNYVDLRR